MRFGSCFMIQIQINQEGAGEIDAIKKLKNVFPHGGGGEGGMVDPLSSSTMGR